MALCVAPVFAAEDTANDTASGQNEGYYIDVYSGDELTKILKRDPGANGPVTVRLGEPQGPYNSRIIVPENVTLDLNGQTVTGYVTLSGSGASIKNGTMDGAGIQIAGADTHLPFLTDRSPHRKDIPVKRIRPRIPGIENDILVKVGKIHDTDPFLLQK